MSVEAMAIALNHSRARGTARLVLIGIANHDGDGGSWPAVGTLARYAGVTPRNVQKALDQLETLGEIRRMRGQGGTQHTADHMRPNLYRVLVGCPSDCDRTTQHRTRNSVQITTELEGVSDATGGVATDRGGVSDATPEPPLNLTIRDKENSSSPKRTREAKSCPKGHDLITDSHCVYGCPDWRARA